MFSITKMRLNSRSILYTSLLLSIENVSAFWRLTCQSSTGLARLDPLMAFDKPGNHVHSIKGGSGFSATSNASDLLNSKCTSCGVQEDKSAYWAPAMYFVGADGNMEVVPEMPPHKSYYFVEPIQETSGKFVTPEAFPVGFQMISGNALKRNSSLSDEGAVPATKDPMGTNPNRLGPWPDESQEQLAERALGFNCLHYGAGNEDSHSRHSLPAKKWLDFNCPDGLRLELMFPSCWNGELDSEGHKKHVAFPTALQGGDCPAGFDRRLVTLFYETIVAIQNFKGRDGQFVLANGDPTGYGYHGDFIAAWEGDSLKNAINDCAEGGGDIAACPAFNTTSLDSQNECQLEAPLPGQIADEDTKGPRAGLPGQVAIQSGPEQATIKLPTDAASSPSALSSPTSVAKAPLVTQSAAASSAEAIHETGLPKAALEHGQAGIFAEKEDVPKQAKAASPSPSPIENSPSSSITPPPVVPTAGSGSILTTKYWTEGQQVHELVEVVVQTTITATTMPPAKRNLDSEAAQHKRRHHHHHHMANAHGIGGRRVWEM